MVSIIEIIARIVLMKSIIEGVNTMAITIDIIAIIKNTNPVMKCLSGISNPRKCIYLTPKGPVYVYTNLLRLVFCFSVYICVFTT